MFVSVEGLDGAGSTTLVEAIGEEYPSTVTTSEPSNLKYGKQVRELLSDTDSDPLMDFYMFMVDRIDHINKRVKPAEEQGKLVISDRYADSTRAYQPVALTQSHAFDSSWEAKSWIEATMGPWNYEPDLTFYIDISVDTAIERASGKEKYENREFLQEVKDNYDALCDSETYGDRMIRIDGEQSPEAVRRSALGKLNIAAPDKI